MQGLNYQLMEKDMGKKMKEIEEQKYAERIKYRMQMEQ